MITDSFDPVSEEILKASDLPNEVGSPESALLEGPFPETVLVCFSPKVEKLLEERYGAEKIGFMMAGVQVPIYRILNPAAEHAGAQPVAVYRTGMGAPFAAAMMEEVIARGGKNFIVFGSCGALNQELAEGHYIIPTESYRDEGTSYHYAAPADYIRIRNADRVAEVFERHHLPFTRGRIWTTDALYRETRKNTADRVADGCIAVDMECSALQAVCDYRGCELYQFVYAEDSLGGENWEPRNMGKVTPGEMEFHLRAALAIAAAL